MRLSAPALCTSSGSKIRWSRPAGGCRSRLSQKDAESALGPWFGGLGFLRPSDLRSTARVEGLKPIWWVGWVFDADALVSWAADSDAGSRRSAWAPHAGQTQLSFDRILVSASRGLSDDETTALVPSYRLDQGSVDAGNHEGMLVEQFDVQRSEARGKILDAAAATAASRVQASEIPGNRFRNVHVELLLRGLKTRRCAFPAYVLAYRYRGNLFRAVVSGQDSSYVTGSAPYSFWKIALLLLGAAGLVALVVAFITMS